MRERNIFRRRDLVETGKAQLSGPVVPLGATLAEHEKEIIEAALADCGGQVAGPTGAAAKLGLPTADARIENHGPGN